MSIEFLAKFLDFLQTFFKSFFRAAHAHIIPHHKTEAFVDGINADITLDIVNLVYFFLYGLLCLLKLWQICRETWNSNLVAQIILDSIRNNEISVSQSLHQSRSTKAVSTMIGEVALAKRKQSLDGSLQFVINPDTTHRIVDGRINHHRIFIRIYVRNLFIHIEEVTITLLNSITA